MNKSKWLELKVFELSYQGHNYRDISEKLQVSIGKISKILHKLNVDARSEVKTWIEYKTPYEYQKSFLLLEYMLKKTIEIAQSTKDERVALEAISRITAIDSAKRQLLCDSFVINSTISTLAKQKKAEILDSKKADRTVSKLPRQEIKRQLDSENTSQMKDSDNNGSKEVTHDEAGEPSG